MTKASKEGQGVQNSQPQQLNPLKGLAATKPILVPPQPK
ncbi:hypothetical protein HAL07_04390 [Helicobacter ailurogastricus]|uniref:Uncharacterized protein n=2 Tax=Helicobacter ailurogastricus TaxID=1578720 RepID=A0A0K2Y092_9HELI|nr:hypothetical protein HAL07_04390 [Helicobacter ailurogastricus]